MMSDNDRLELLVKNLDAMDRYYSQRPVDAHIGTITTIQLALRDVRSAIVYATNGLVWQSPRDGNMAASIPSMRPGTSTSGKTNNTTREKRNDY